MPPTLNEDIVTLTSVIYQFESGAYISVHPANSSSRSQVNRANRIQLIQSVNQKSISLTSL